MLFAAGHAIVVLELNSGTEPCAGVQLPHNMALASIAGGRAGIVRRRNAEVFFEAFRKISGIIKTDLKSNFG
jgi:hypothetical protein